MPAPITQDDLNRYGDLLSEIKARVEHAVTLLDGVTLHFDLEAAALQLRTAIELIFLGTLVVNRQSLTEITTALEGHDWSAAKKLIARVNPNYWPEPFVARVSPESTRMLVPLTGSYLTKENAGPTWGYLSGFLHAANPFARDPVDDAVVSRLNEIVSGLTQLLGLHTVDLGEREHLILAMMDEPGTGLVYAHVLNAAASAPQ